MSASAKPAGRPGLSKSATGIAGLDDITGGGLPTGRPTLVSGTAGCGKTLMGLEFLVRGALQFGEPGVLIAFEERPEELVQNVRSLGYDLEDLARRKLLLVDYVHLDRSQIDETGEYDLEGLFVRLGHAIDSIGAKRVVLDTIETLFSALSNEAILRAELRRLFRFLKDKGVTALVTCERGDGTLTRHGIEEYVSDCVILLDHRVDGQRSTRRLRVVKYRGTAHGTDEYPFLIDEHGFHVFPITSVGLNHECSSERITSGVPRLDGMLGGAGFYRGSTILVSGTAGTGKTSLAAHLAHATCARGERCLYFAFEESPSQIKRNMRSIGLDLSPWEEQGLLQFHANRPTVHGLETHLALIQKQVEQLAPSVVILDPITNLVAAGGAAATNAMLVRLIDLLKTGGITALLTSLTSVSNSQTEEQTDVGISSLVDTWLLVRDIESAGERNRGLYVLKSRGMKHSNQIREFVLTNQGIELLDVYVGPEGVLTGSARLAQEATERAATLVREQEMDRRRRELARKRKALDAKVAALHAEYDVDQEEARHSIDEGQAVTNRLLQDREDMARSRGADVNGDRA
jgi:circadian clock protein KaiC